VYSIVPFGRGVSSEYYIISDLGGRHDWYSGEIVCSGKCHSRTGRRWSERVCGCSRDSLVSVESQDCVNLDMDKQSILITEDTALSQLRAVI
jgi:hypothetical protein